MKQTIFTTRQRAEEILKEAAAIWEHSANSEHLEGMEQDPVFSLLMTALAYQANEIDNEIEQLRTEILDEFARILIPYEQIHALPATALIEVAPDDRVTALKLDHNTRFALSDSPFTFIPLLDTKVFNCDVASIVRLDNRRWKVNLQFKEPVACLSGMTFTVDSRNFHELKIFANGHPLPLIKPWDYADLPIDSCFSVDNMLFNTSTNFQPRHTWFDLFAKQDVKMYAVDSYGTSGTVTPTEKMELVFEFFGIDDNFMFDKEHLFLNCTLLVNAVVRSATLSSQTPVVRLSGETDSADKWQFLHLIRPSELQLFRDEPFEIRRIATNRFDADRLAKLATTLVTRFSSDYYAFQEIESLREGGFMEQFYGLLKKMSEGLAKISHRNASGLYLMLKNIHGFHPKEISLDMEYLMTNGSAANPFLNGKSKFTASPSSHIKATRLIAEPRPGYDELQNIDAKTNLARYYMITNDRIVTPSDIKALCNNELATRFGITDEMVEKIRIKNVRNTERGHCGFETRVFISLKDNPYIKRSFQEKIPMIELSLQKMIEVRSTNVFPVQVTIEII